jgi:hypothetical protein
VGLGHPVGDVGVADLPLGPDDSLGDGRFVGEERPGYLFGGQAAESAQRESDPCLEREGGMAAGEDEPQPVIADGLGVEVEVVFCEGGHRAGDLRQFPGAGCLTAQAVQGFSASRGNEPRRGAGWDAFGPCRCRGYPGFLERVLGEVEIAQHADERGQRRRVVPGEQRSEGFAGRHHAPSTMARTSTAPVRAAGSFAAQRKASEASRHSIR